MGGSPSVIWICSFKWKAIQNANIQLYFIISEFFFSTAVISCVFLHKCRWIVTIQTRESAFVQETSFFWGHPASPLILIVHQNPVSTQRCVQKPHPGCRTRTRHAGFSGHDSWSNWPWLKPAVAHLLLAVPPSAPMCPSLFSRKKQKPAPGSELSLDDITAAANTKTYKFQDLWIFPWSYVVSLTNNYCNIVSSALNSALWLTWASHQTFELQLNYMFRPRKADHVT